MTFADNILFTLHNAKHYSVDLLTDLVAKQSYGEDVCELENKFILIGKWIEMLQGYYDANYDSSGNTITPAYTCLTQVQIEELIAKLKIAIGNNKYPLAWNSLGLWMDYPFFWDDNDTWYDTLPLT